MSTLYPDLAFSTFPNSAQTFVTMLNMVASDGPLIKQYQTAMEDGNIPLAQSIYAQITNADAKFIDATKLNTLMQTCVALQRFYLTDVQPYINTKQEEWQETIDEFSYQGRYSPSVQYVKNNFVLYNFNGVDLLFLCITTPPTSNRAPNNTTYWRQLTIRGIKGDSGEGLAFLYEWDAGTSYSLQDSVTSDNMLWGSKLTPNINQPPYIGSPYWEVVGPMGQAVYPLQSDTPLNQSAGELWFKVL